MHQLAPGTVAKYLAYEAKVAKNFEEMTKIVFNYGTSQLTTTGKTVNNLRDVYSRIRHNDQSFKSFKQWVEINYLINKQSNESTKRLKNPFKTFNTQATSHKRV